VRFAFIRAEKAKHDVSTLCRVLQVRRSGYYAWLDRDESARTKDNRLLAVEIAAMFTEMKKRYGSPRIQRELSNRGRRVCRHRIARLLREQRLQARARRKFVRTTHSNPGLPTPPNVLDRDFTPKAPNCVWAGDVTYLPTREGWLYLAVMLDLYSRRVVGWAMSEHNDEALTLAALRMAIDQRRPEPGLVHHSDRGTTYASGAYQDELAKHGFVCSMSRKGNCWDNAVVESFFSSLDIECENGDMFLSRMAARREVADYILGFYNPTRLHSTLGYVSPMEYERAAV
jgi:transposase InsO family protein